MASNPERNNRVALIENELRFISCDLNDIQTDDHEAVDENFLAVCSAIRALREFQLSQPETAATPPAGVGGGLIQGVQASANEIKT